MTTIAATGRNEIQQKPTPVHRNASCLRPSSNSDHRGLSHALPPILINLKVAASLRKKRLAAVSGAHVQGRTQEVPGNEKWIWAAYG